MNPPCAKCNKTVYPVEKFNCLDKIWHKACFRCKTCDLKLTMNTYKGYNKFPYCKTHYPVTKFTQVADNPEAKRLAQQQKNQSDLVYRKDKSEALKGFTQVADSVATRTAAHASKLASNLGYQTAPHDVGHEGRPRPENIVNRQPAHQPPQQYQAPAHQPPQQYQAPAHQPPQQYQEPAQPQPPPPPQPQAPPQPQQPRYVAQYDYTAADDDEISFVEGDVMVDVTVIDEGWMEGRNVRTAAYGMFPSNYVEKC